MRPLIGQKYSTNINVDANIKRGTDVKRDSHIKQQRPHPLAALLENLR
ncbi:hypothetical protein [Pectobacterium wasabiae]|nr:hypothetical protein [Pectobacterium wasabiae]